MRASSITAAVPLPSSFTPGAGESGSKWLELLTRSALLVGERPAERDRIVVSSHQHLPILVDRAGQDRHDVRNLDIACNASLFLDPVRIKGHFQARAVCAKFGGNPIPRSSDTMLRIGLRGKDMPGSEPFESLERRGDALLGDLCNHSAHRWIDRILLPESWKGQGGDPAQGGPNHLAPRP